MNNKLKSTVLIASIAILIILCSIHSCKKAEKIDEADLTYLTEYEEMTGLKAEYISFDNFKNGIEPSDFQKHSGAPYKASYNEEPTIPAQCWIETSYGTQNACKYCHTNYLTEIKHGNNWPIAEDQILFSFPSPDLNKVLWTNIIKPEEIIKRLEEENISIPQPGDPAILTYIRANNWIATYNIARGNGDDSWNNISNADSEFQLFPALNPNDLFPYYEENPTDNGTHGYVDQEGFVKDKNDEYTGWRAVNFFPYALFTPLTGSVSGIYIRLPREFMTKESEVDIDIYKKNLELLVKNIKNMEFESEYYYGAASGIKVLKGFYPGGTEFAHPLHYVDLNADNECGTELDGLNNNDSKDYEFPGTRSKRVKEIRYMYKWKDVTIEDIAPKEEEEEEAGRIIGKEWKGWIDNNAGWVISAYIEDREGNLRPQTTEELCQCLGCHGEVGNTIDSVWSFQRKLPAELGWQEMNYGYYKKSRADKTKLQDYYNQNMEMGELEYFYYTVVGADLFGIMPAEIEEELIKYAEESNLVKELALKNNLNIIFDDDKLKNTAKDKRKEVLLERAQIMRHYASSRSYLYHDPASGNYYIKGNIFYPFVETMKANIAGYMRIVLDQSFNLGKNVFGTQPGHIPFTFRSDGTVVDADGKIIPVGSVIISRPWGENGVGITPTGIVKVNDEGEPIDEDGNVVDIDKNAEDAVGHLSKGGTFETKYNPIITDKPVKSKPKKK
jgi:hypothetical protein